MDRQLTPRRPTPRRLTALAAVALLLAVAGGPDVALPGLPGLPAVGTGAGAPPAPYVLAPVDVAGGTAGSPDEYEPVAADAHDGRERTDRVDRTDRADRTTGADASSPASSPAADPSLCVVPGVDADEWVVATFHDRGSRAVLATATLEVADEVRERERGLMGRESLPAGRGMLFEFPDEAPRSFWMKDTYVPLDIVFLDADGVVLNVESADPEPGVADDDLRRYRSDGPAQHVVEVERGFAAANGVEPGTGVRFADVDECR
jgi:uncharacterized membrane protein (UPF0127 family)